MSSILDHFLVTDKVAIVTGAGRGIGAASAKALAQAGADVVISSRTREDLDLVAKEVEAVGRRCHVVPADLSDTAAVANLVDEAKEAFGRVDIVVNNVGGTYPMPFMETTEEFLEEAFHFNVTTAFALTKAAVPAMLEQGGGAVVNISSTMGRMAERGFLGYGTAKAALAHLTRLASFDLAPKIRVNGIFVGATATSALEIVVANEELKTSMEQATPLQRIGTPEEIASTVLFLASDAGGYFTGKVLEADGGIQHPNLSFGLPDL